MTDTKKGAERQSEGKIPLESLADFPNAMAAFAKVCEGGTIDHKRDSWRKGRPIRATFGSLFRHAFKAYAGEDFDADFFKRHKLEILNLAQVMWNAAAMIEWLADPDLDVDDRNKKGVDPELIDSTRYEFTREFEEAEQLVRDWRKANCRVAEQWQNNATVTSASLNDIINRARHLFGS